MRFALPAVGAVILVVASDACCEEPALRRRALLGARLAEVSAEVRKQRALGEGGVLLERIVPASSAAKAGLQAGDIVLTVDDEKITGVSSLLQQIALRRGGEQINVQYVRDGTTYEKRVALQEMPREKGDGYDVIYSSISNGDVRLRTIITRPRTGGHRPAVLLLQGGHTCFAIDDPFGRPTPFVRVAQHLARNGYVTMRVERPGCGDSEGGPLRDVDFGTELSGNRQALRSLKQLDFVDADNVLIYGFSMGGIMAPLIAVDEPVRGIAVYGTACLNFFENVIDQRRRLTLLSGKSPAEVDEELLGHIRFWYQLTVEKKSLREIRAAESIPKSVWNLWVREDAYVAGRHFKFYHQLAEENLAAAWAKYAATPLPASTDEQAEYPRVLAIWGRSDWHADGESAAWIAEIVNRSQRGHGTYVALDASDHFCNHVATPEESYRLLYGDSQDQSAGFNPAILETLLTWCNSTITRQTES